MDCFSCQEWLHENSVSDVAAKAIFTKERKPEPWVCIDIKLPCGYCLERSPVLKQCSLPVSNILSSAGVGNNLSSSVLASRLFSALIRRPVVDICCQLKIADRPWCVEVFPCGLGQ